jgi:hypothetical protein
VRRAELRLEPLNWPPSGFGLGFLSDFGALAISLSTMGGETEKPPIRLIPIHRQFPVALSGLALYKFAGIQCRYNKLYD